MINFQRSQPAPKSLAKEKKKKSGSYREADVLDRLKKDFFGKCYICERKNLTAINIEHLRPHRGDPDKEFDWNNLCWSCSHCNNTKLSKKEFDRIFDCCDDSHHIIASIRMEIRLFPKERPYFHAEKNSPESASTIELLDQVFMGTTMIKRMESNSIREALVREMNEFNSLLHEFYSDNIGEARKQLIRDDIKVHLSPASAFCGFKIWAIRSSKVLDDEFGEFYKSHQPGT